VHGLQLCGPDTSGRRSPNTGCHKGCLSCLSLSKLANSLQAGIDVASLAAPGTGILQYTGFQMGGARKLRQRLITVTHTCLGGEQQDFVRALAGAAEEQHAGRSLPLVCSPMLIAGQLQAGELHGCSQCGLGKCTTGTCGPAKAWPLPAEPSSEQDPGLSMPYLTLPVPAGSNSFHAGSIKIHWEAEITGVDFGSKHVTVRLKGGEERVASYDLLVGADGWASKVGLPAV
jgi:hypothetical protein